MKYSDTLERERFVDALREVLGMKPLYNPGRNDRPGWVGWYRPLMVSAIGDGNRRVSGDLRSQDGEAPFGRRQRIETRPERATIPERELARLRNRYPLADRGAHTLAGHPVGLTFVTLGRSR